tara:strand:- start:732 stop:1145 length:414 start_codon:yes stop_codon:yes gene_type:complete
LTIYSIAIRKSAAGDNAIQITAKTDDGRYATEWLGVKAPDAIFEIWRNALGTEPMKAVLDGSGWGLIGLEFKGIVVKTEKFGNKMEDVCNLDTPEPKTETKTETDFTDFPTEPKTETDFTDFPTEPKKEDETNEIPF